MGVETAFVLAAIAAGATVAKGTAEAQAAAATQHSLDQQAAFSAVQYQEKTLQNLDTIDKMLSKQAAQLSTRGVAFSSPSFNAIQRETLNVGSRKQQNLNTEQSIAQESYKIEKQNVKNTLHAQLFGDAANFAFGAATLNSQLPKSLPKAENIR
jgi:hypothetical protein